MLCFIRFSLFVCPVSVPCSSSAVSSCRISQEVEKRDDGGWEAAGRVARQLPSVSAPLLESWVLWAHGGTGFCGLAFALLS